jgi:hypothetical protein
MINSQVKTPNPVPFRKEHVKSDSRYMRSVRCNTAPGFTLASEIYAQKENHSINISPDSHKLKFANLHSPQTTKIVKKARVSSKADRILDAPDVINDYYLNLLSWSE